MFRVYQKKGFIIVQAVAVFATTPGIGVSADWSSPG